MSRITVYSDDKLTVVTGDDHAVGIFFQVFDEDMVSEFNDGLVFDWSEMFKIETNVTGQPNSLEPLEIINNYINEKNAEKQGKID
jgi:hypothetical protein